MCLIGKQITCEKHCITFSSFSSSTTFKEKNYNFVIFIENSDKYLAKIASTHDYSHLYTPNTKNQFHNIFLFLFFFFSQIIVKNTGNFQIWLLKALTRNNYFSKTILKVKNLNLFYY